jgi:hypothetical protein
MADEHDNDFLKEEEENDPTRIQKEAIRIQKEGLAFYKGILEKQQKEEAERAARGLTAVCAPVPYLASREPSKQITIQVRKIDNGFILARIKQTYHPDQQAEETYYQTVPELLKGLGTIVEGTFVEIPDGT